MTRFQTVARTAAIVVASLLALVVFLLLYLWLSVRVWYPRQRARVAELHGEAVVPVDEDARALHPLDDRRPFSSLRVIASHNSYHRQPDAIRRLLIDLVEPGEGAKLRYSHEPLWAQLEHGIRSFELDVRARRDRFTITHVPLVDATGPHPDLRLTLEELVLWSERRPGHVPIVVLLELKSDYTFLDPGLVAWDAAVLDRLDTLVTDIVPAERLLTPAMVRRDAGSMLEAVTEYGWPALGEARDRIMFVVHTDPAIDRLYVADDPTLSRRPMFTSGSGDARSDAVVVIHNTPDPLSIRSLLARNLLVRTRADADGRVSAEERAAAFASGAQIVSTDLPPGHPNEHERDVVEFAPGVTLSQE